MDSISLMLSQYGTLVETIHSTRDLTYRAFFHILKRLKSAISISELCRIASEESLQVHEYLGDRLDMEHNYKIRPIIDILLNNHGEAIVLQFIERNSEQIKRRNDYLSDAYDASEVIKENNKEDIFIRNEIRSDTSDTLSNSINDSSKPSTATTVTTTSTGEQSRFRCFYCKEAFHSDLERTSR